MSFVAVLLIPFVLLFPGTSESERRERPVEPATAPGTEWPPVAEWPEAQAAPLPGGGWLFRDVAEGFRVQSQNQVRIEQHMSIRIAPQSRPLTMPPRFILEMQRQQQTQPQQPQFAPRFVERNIGRCLSVAAISGVQPDAGSRLILFLRDRRMISAVLDRACRARDFYSGFYVARTNDGQICVDRDTLLSRSGANCKLTRIRQLVDAGD
jgi:hypothetical protein